MMAWFVGKQSQPQQDEQDAELVVEVLSTECAWCNAENGIEQGSGSHGICDYHAEQMKAASHARRGARR